MMDSCSCSRIYAIRFSMRELFVIREYTSYVLMAPVRNQRRADSSPCGNAGNRHIILLLRQVALYAKNISVAILPKTLSSNVTPWYSAGKITEGKLESSRGQCREWHQLQPQSDCARPILKHLPSISGYRRENVYWFCKEYFLVGCS
jgi:hypothetical protein